MSANHVRIGIVMKTWAPSNEKILQMRGVLIHIHKANEEGDHPIIEWLSASTPFVHLCQFLPPPLSSAVNTFFSHTRTMFNISDVTIASLSPSLAIILLCALPLHELARHGHTAHLAQASRVVIRSASQFHHLFLEGYNQHVILPKFLLFDQPHFASAETMHRLDEIWE